MADDESVMDNGRFGRDPAGHAAMLTFARRFSDQVWAIERCAGRSARVVRFATSGATSG
jgi:hypothetical protein